MAKSYFAILGISSLATADEVRTAYRRLVKAYHPDHYRGSSKTFRDVQEAYHVLGDPDRRRAYERTLENVRVRRAPAIRSNAEPEPLIPERRPADLGEISPIRSFETVTPSFNEVFDWLWSNFSNVDATKSGRMQNLTLEVPLTREQARRGGNARIMVPARTICSTCRGHGHIGYYECHRCAGEGGISGEVPICVSFPPGLTKDHSVIIPLARLGIRNLHFTVLFRPRDAV